MAYAEAEKLRAEGYAKADVMRAQGFNYQQETQRDIGVSLAKNEGNGATSAVSSLVQAGIGLGAMASISKETIHTMNGVMDNSSNSWTCSKCGFALNKGKFCQECGEKKVEVIESWKCNACGYEGNTSKFCQECGAKRG